MAIAQRQFARQHGAGRTVNIADVGFYLHRCFIVQSGHGFGNQLAVENIVNRMVLALRVEDFLIRFNFGEQAGEVEALCFLMTDCIARIQQIGLPDNFVQ